MSGSSIDDIYNDLLGSPLVDALNMSSYREEDEEEEFMTSKEIMEQKKKLESKLGIAPGRPGTGPRGGEPGIEEDVHFKRYTVRREHKYSETEMQRIRESCSATIVHDYGEHDIYHMSDEERIENDVLAELRPKLRDINRTYRKVDKYVEAMRVVVAAWKILEKNNFIHTRDEFYKLVSEGKIYSSSIIMPKLKKIDNYNMDVLIQYISNPQADASQLAPEIQEPTDAFYDSFLGSDDPWYNYFYDIEMARIIEEEKDKTEEDEKLSKYDMNAMAHEYATKKVQERTVARMLTPEQVKFLEDNMDDPPEIKVQDLRRKYRKNYDRRTFSTKRKRKKKGSKTDRYITDVTHMILNKIQANASYSSASEYNRSHLITQSMFEDVKPKKDFWEDKRFYGSWANKDDVLLYDLQVREALMEERPEGQRYYTFGDQQLAAFFKALEDHGISTLDLRRRMNMTVDLHGTDPVIASARKKENKKLEAAILQRITKFNKDPKFKKLVSKAENALNKRFEEGG